MWKFQLLKNPKKKNLPENQKKKGEYSRNYYYRQKAKLVN